MRVFREPTEALYRGLTKTLRVLVNVTEPFLDCRVYPDNLGGSVTWLNQDS